MSRLITEFTIQCTSMTPLWQYWRWKQLIEISDVCMSKGFVEKDKLNIRNVLYEFNIALLFEMW